MLLFVIVLEFLDVHLSLQFVIHRVVFFFCVFALYQLAHISLPFISFMLSYFILRNFASVIFVGAFVLLGR